MTFEEWWEANDTVLIRNIMNKPVRELPQHVRSACEKAWNDSRKQCKDCKWWEGNNETYPLGYAMGECSGMIRTDQVTIVIQTGWEGGHVNAIMTDSDFWCKGFEMREE
jgi:hypothetical protein